MVLAGSVEAQTSFYKKVGDRVVPKNSQDWRVMRDRLEVAAVNANKLVIRTFKVEEKSGAIRPGTVAANRTQKKTYMEEFTLINYPGTGGFKGGDEIHGPIMAMPTGTTKVLITWAPTELDLRYASGRGWVDLPLYDYGTDFTPATSPVKVKTAAGDTNSASSTGGAKKPDAAAVATFKFHLQKAMAGEVGSQYRVGQLYLEGKGVEQNTKQAIMWFEKAKAQGNEEAAAELITLGK